MGLRINHNIQSVNSHRNLQRNDFLLGKSMEKLSSGLRVNRAADDPAGLVISEQMRAQIVGLETAISNSETAASMIQTAEGALDEMNSLLQKARSLALHAANEGANDVDQLVADQSEMNNIIDSITRIAENTQFGTKRILDGSMSSFRSNSDLVGSSSAGNHYAEGIAAGSIIRGYHSLQIQQEATQGYMEIGGSVGTGVVTGGTILAMTGSDEFLKGVTFAVDGNEISIVSGQTKNDLLNALNALGKDLGFQAYTTGAISGDAGTATSGDIRLAYDAYGSNFSLSYSFVEGATGFIAMSGIHVDGTDMSGVLLLNTGALGNVASTGNTAYQINQTGNQLVLAGSSGYRIELNQALTTGTYLGVIDGMNAGATFQVGANAGQTVTVDLASMRAEDIGQGAVGSFNNLADLKGGSLTSGLTDEALAVIDDAIDDVTVQRGKLGAFQANTLETGINSLRVTRENTISAEATIRDVDFAAESANFAKLNIMVQSSTAMLAQANQLPQNVLQLLG